MDTPSNQYQLKINFVEDNIGNKIYQSTQEQQAQDQTPSTYRRRDGQNFLIPRTSIKMMNQSQKRFSKITAGLSYLTISNVFDHAFKINIVQYINSQDKKISEIRFLKKHLQNCNFFQNYAIPLGDDVFEQCIQKLQIKTLQPNTYLIQKGDQVENLYILLIGSALKTQQKLQKSENIILQSEQDQFTPSNYNFSSMNSCFQIHNAALQVSPKSQFLYDVNSALSSQSNFNQNKGNKDAKIEPITSLFEQQFLQRSDSTHYIYNTEECVYAYINSSTFAQIIKNSKNSELIQNLNEIRRSQFLSDWPVIKLKSIINQSTIKSYQRNQYVYKQGDQSSFWYLILDGEFEYEKEFSINNEINDIQKACLDKVAHEFKKQNIVTDESQKGKGFLRVSLLQQGELFGLEDLIPKDLRRYNLKCISNVGTVRQINEQLFYKLISKSSEESQKLQNLANQKLAWLQKATEEKMPINKKIFNTILDSKRNRTIQLIKQQEEYKEKEMQNIAKMVMQAETNINNDQRNRNRSNLANNPSFGFKNTNNHETQRDVLGLAENTIENQIKDSINKKVSLQKDKKRIHQLINQIQSPIKLIQPENKITFLQPTDDEESRKNKIQKELSQERKKMIEAKEDLLSQYRVSIDKYVSENNQKLYKKIEFKKLGANYYMKSHQQGSEDHSGQKQYQKINEKDSLTPIRCQIKKQLNCLGEDQSQKKDFNSRLASRQASSILGDQHSKSINQLQLSLKSSLASLENSNQPINTIKPLIIPNLQLKNYGLGSQSPILIQTARSFSQNQAQNQNYTNESSYSEQSSPLLSFQNKLFIPQNTKKIIFKQNSQNTPNSTILEKYSMSTQSSFFKKGNELFEQIMTARNHQSSSRQAYRSSSQYKASDGIGDSFQLNIQPQKQNIHNDNQIIKHIKQKMSQNHKRSSSLIH
ncbi:cyclic nucleotide-binding domain protein (macronuclear) [Tetrahymena thermophila SB210]|uniref:Cyclic nucleotide-binding domain protein n=1 Tax=Tetrahymena thermophila (strain SB210) TaxID=312017 RepID=I7MED1_TETTS|nr:cyclic nucleotide-binding domain protein [Tetrahymena thermophila SB210]EAR96104.1 cyclic nucleotide-binding domain protein [Tetrahymena thermophila SB210]|eukprot:XP_001016349.1 cyclic nucleotide-binding domain protein [Tetrahymena thermophila SB210]